MYFHPQKLDRNTIPIFPYLNRVGKWDFSCHQISIKDFVSSACFCLASFARADTSFIPAA